MGRQSGIPTPPQRHLYFGTAEVRISRGQQDYPELADAMLPKGILKTGRPLVLRQGPPEPVAEDGAKGLSLLVEDYVHVGGLPLT